jgi:hypothetical protein
MKASENRGTPLGRAAHNRGMAIEQCDDLFSGKPAVGLKGMRRRPQPELVAARVLCNQLKRKKVGAEKKRIIHLICLNLLAILKRRSQVV